MLVATGARGETWRSEPLATAEEGASAVAVGEDGRVAVEIDTAIAKALHGDKDHQYTITAEVRDEMLAGILGDIPLLQTGPSVWVREDDFARADKIVREFQRERVEAGEAWRCACGETLGAQFTACWRCSRSRAEEPRP